MLYRWFACYIYDIDMICFVIFSFNDKSLTLREELGLKNGLAWLGLAWLEKVGGGLGGGGRSASPPRC